MSPIISVTESSVRRSGQWVAESDGLRHAALTNDLNDNLELEWGGVHVSAELSTSPQRKIAVVVTFNGQPIPQEIAGSSIEWGEGQSFVFVERRQMYELIGRAPIGHHKLALFTRSDKLICHSFTSS